MIICYGGVERKKQMRKHSEETIIITNDSTIRTPAKQLVKLQISHRDANIWIWMYQVFAFIFIRTTFNRENYG